MIVGDFAQIECRCLGWFAGQKDLIETFRTGGDPYCDMASTIYGRKITKKDAHERFIGKTVVLGAGYGCGPDVFKDLLDTTYDVQVDDAFAKKVVYSFRSRYPRIPGFWKLMDDGVKHVLTQKGPRYRIQASPPIYMGLTTMAGMPSLYIEMPGGRRLYYANPETDGDDITYDGKNKVGHWCRVHSWGGKFVENLVQSFSMVLMVDAMLRLEEDQFALTMTVHDEIVAEGADAERFKKIMDTVPAYAAGLPIASEVFVSRRYRK